MRVRKNAELRRPEILKSFYETIVAEGVEGASIGKTAKRMGIHPSLIMHYFSTKERMMVELVDQITGEYQTLLDGLKNVKGDPRDRFLKLMDLIWSDAWYAMTDISADFSVISTSFRNRDIHKRLHLMYANFKKYLVKELKSFAGAGIIDVEDPARSAEIIIAMLEGYRHFKHFFIDAASAGPYKQDMKQALLAVLHYHQDTPKGESAAAIPLRKNHRKVQT
jgi:AcrR family transcriptional regulator